MLTNTSENVEVSDYVIYKESEKNVQLQNRINKLIPKANSLTHLKQLDNYIQLMPLNNELNYLITKKLRKIALTQKFMGDSLRMMLKTNNVIIHNASKNYKHKQYM